MRKSRRPGQEGGLLIGQLLKVTSQIVYIKLLNYSSSTAINSGQQCFMAELI